MWVAMFSTISWLNLQKKNKKEKEFQLFLSQKLLERGKNYSFVVNANPSPQINSFLNSPLNN